LQRDAGIRKYGFHGTSVQYVVEKVTELMKTIQPDKDPAKLNLIVCHLGNGASVTAVSGGKSVETSMGFSPLSGLMMGTRSGSVDPSIVSHAFHHLYKGVDEVLDDLNKESGLKAMVDDHEYDMRTLILRSKDDPNAALAVDMFVYHLAQHVASSLVALKGPVDAIVFTAGIGEHSAEIRFRCIDLLQSILNLELDPTRNQANGKDSCGVLTIDSSSPLVLDIATDEEAMIAKDCLRLIPQTSQVSNKVSEYLVNIMGLD
jgi:acetate kinase